LEGRAAVLLVVESIGAEEDESVHLLGIGDIGGEGFFGISAGEELFVEEGVEELFA
jgi:hypothetical protein